MKNKVSLQKHTVRKKLKAVRLDKRRQIASASNKIQEHIKEFFNSLPEIKRVFIYIERGTEIMVSPLIPWLKKTGIKIFVPVYDQGAWKITEVSDRTKYREGKFGTMQPDQFGQTFENVNQAGFTKNDLAIIPGLAFSSTGDRIGYGKGVYDRYLADSSVYKLGVCMDCQIRVSLPQDSHDVKVDSIITEEGILMRDVNG